MSDTNSKAKVAAEGLRTTLANGKYVFVAPYRGGWLLEFFNGEARTTVALTDQALAVVIALYVQLRAPSNAQQAGDAWLGQYSAKYSGETGQTMAEIGEAFMDAMPKGYNWLQSPAEIIADQANKIHAAQQASVALSTRVRELEAGLAKFVNKIDSIHKDPSYLGVWELNQIRNGQYMGPNYAAELADIRALLPQVPTNVGDGK